MYLIVSPNLPSFAEVASGSAASVFPPIPPAPIEPVDQHLPRMAWQRQKARVLAEATSNAVGAIVGGIAGASTSLTTDTNNRQESIAEISLIKKLAEDKAKQMCTGNSDCIMKMTLSWADALEKISEGNIDSAEAAKNMVYLIGLANASKDPNSEGARG